MTDDQWNEYKKRSRGWSIRMSFELLHSEAYKRLSYSPAIKVLNWFYEKVKFEVNKGKRGKNRYQVINGDISFTYREAGFRGMSHHQFSRALREVYQFGFIEVTRAGSALKGDFTRFEISDRWKDYGTYNFKGLEFPKSMYWVNFGYGSKKREQQKVRCRN